VSQLNRKRRGKPMNCPMPDPNIRNSIGFLLPKSECCGILTDELICYMAKCTLMYGKAETERRIKEAIKEAKEEYHIDDRGGIFKRHEEQEAK